MAILLDIRKPHRNSDGVLVFNEWWVNFNDTLPREFPEREQAMKRHGIDIRPILDMYMNKRAHGDLTFKLRFENNADATLFLLRFS
jgi:hypothetical protein